MINDQSIYDPLYSWQTYDATMYGYTYTHHNAIQKVSWFDWLYSIIIIIITIIIMDIIMGSSIYYYLLWVSILDLLGDWSWPAPVRLLILQHADQKW